MKNREQEVKPMDKAPMDQRLIASSGDSPPCWELRYRNALGSLDTTIPAAFILYSRWIDGEGVDRWKSHEFHKQNIPGIFEVFERLTTEINDR